MSYLICFGLFVLIVILIVYLSHGSEAWKEMKYRKNQMLDSCNAIKGLRNVRIANGPVLCVKAPGQIEYSQIPIVNRMTKIGSSRSSDVVLPDEFVEPVHAMIKKVVHDNDSHYELINLSKYNPIQWFNQMTNDYEVIGYKRGIVLENQEAFYIGESKVLVKCPVAKHKPSRTERLIVNRSSMMETADTDMDMESRMSADVTQENEYEAYPKAEPTKRYEGRTRCYSTKRVG